MIDLALSLIWTVETPWPSTLCVLTQSSSSSSSSGHRHFLPLKAFVDFLQRESSPLCEFWIPRVDLLFLHTVLLPNQYLSKYILRSQTHHWRKQGNTQTAAAIREDTWSVDLTFSSSAVVYLAHSTFFKFRFFFSPSFSSVFRLTRKIALRRVGTELRR